MPCFSEHGRIQRFFVLLYFSQSQYSEQPFTIRCLKLKRKLFIALPSRVGVARLESK